MGNGAISSTRVLDFDDYNILEKLCRKGHFRNNPDDYKEAIHHSISNNNLDTLELLISAGRIEDHLPIHTAATFASLDCIEILISAGINPCAIDARGRTPLHCSADKKKSSSNICSCVTLLSMTSPRTVDAFDSSGFTPLHLAIKANNIEIIKALVSSGSSLTKPTKSGKSPLLLAAELGFEDIRRYIDNTLMSKNNAGNTRQIPKALPKNEAPVDPMRIMLVWEKFFENAMKFAETQQDDGEEEEDSEEEKEYKSKRNNNKLSQNTGNSIPLLQAAAMVSGFGNGEVKSYYPEDEEDATIYDESNNNIDYRITEWLSWVVCYSINNDQDDIDSKYDEKNNFQNGGEYYTIHKVTGESLWLEDQLQTQSSLGLWRSDGIGGELTDELLYSCIEDLSVISSLTEVVRYGWLTYYDKDSNECFWMHLSTGHTEHYLPIGYDPCVYYLGLDYYEHDTSWVRADQTLSYAWTVIVIDQEVVESPVIKHSIDFKDYGTNAKKYKQAKREVEEEEEEGGGWYYFNRLTGHSDWEAPVGWADIVRDSGGWTLCRRECEEEYYWWHESSGAVAAAS